MKLRLFILPALMITGLFAQGPDGFGGGRRAFNDGPAGDSGPGAPRDRMFRGGRMGMRDGMGPREFALGRLLEDPNIRQQAGVTADQAAKIRQQESDFRKSEIRNRADLQIKRMELQDLLMADKPDRAAVDGKLQEVGAAQTAMEKSAIDNRLNMRDALTPVQRQKLEQIMRQPRQLAAAPNAAPRGPQGGPQGFGRGPRGGAVPPTPPVPPRPIQ